MITLNAKIVLADGCNVEEAKEKLHDAVSAIKTAGGLLVQELMISTREDRFGKRLRAADIRPDVDAVETLADYCDGEMNNDHVDDTFEFPDGMGREL
jgi:hypothetical protein